MLTDGQKEQYKVYLREFCPVCQAADIEIIGIVDGDPDRAFRPGCFVVHIHCLDPNCDAFCIETYGRQLVDIEEEEKS